ncbi:hypothetical protein [Nonomuraea turcica]|uniref:hypothetical protein n=1 Tax=Nonomuraea sp. G32 TaxID=3067274 RepID=UPI00273C92C8|nr:hypothetical protein [Nonomuraea sp. G32]MDP4505859.1 hypothetical protein [Nonomuraea sp. G32]
MRRPPSHFDYHGLHVAAAQAQAVRVDWAPSQPRADRLRIREHTCACTYPMFELCTAAGLWFVRRITDEAPEAIVESAWMSARAARDLWMQIVTGQAW